MSATAPPAKKKGRTPKPARAARTVERLSRDTLIQRRDRCIGEIVQLRSNANAPDPLADKARMLLTKHWSVSSWRSRADLVRTAEWLIGIGRKEPGETAGAPLRARERG